MLGQHLRCAVEENFLLKICGSYRFLQYKRDQPSRLQLGDVPYRLKRTAPAGILSIAHLLLSLSGFYSRKALLFSKTLYTLRYAHTIRRFIIYSCYDFWLLFRS